MLALAAFAFATSGFSNEAHAAFTVRLDKSSNPSSAVTWAGTTNLISVCVVLNGIDPNCWPVDTARALIARTNHDFFSLFFEHTDIKTIRVTNNGNNAFWLDQIELFDTFGTEVWSNGVDNTGGWCFSTQASDGNSPNCSGRSRTK